MSQVPLIKGDKVDSNTDYKDALPVNMYAVLREILGAKGYMTNFYGISSFGTGSGIDRGGRWVSRKGFEGHYRVSGTKFISVSTSGAETILGDIPGTDQVSIAFSFNNVAVVASGSLFYYNPTDGFRQITDIDAGSPIDIVWVDGLFFLTDGETIYHSDIADENNYLTVDFDNAEFQPDSSLGLGLNEDNEVIVFGELSKENFIFTGKSEFTFVTIPRKTQKIGILGTHCRKEMGGKWYILGRREESAPSFHIVSLGNEQVISTRETDKILATYTDDELSTSTVDAFIDDNVNFVVYHLPNHTLLFNETISEAFGIGSAWVILKSDVIGETPYRGKNFVRDPRIGKWLCGDRQNSNIGELDNTICTHYGDIAEWIMFTPLIKAETLSVNQLELETIPGIAPDNDATVFFSITANGRSYGTEYTMNYGDNNDYDQRFIMHNLGYVRHWIGFKFRGASSARMSFAFLNVDAS